MRITSSPGSTYAIMELSRPSVAPVATAICDSASIFLPNPEEYTFDKASLNSGMPLFADQLTRMTWLWFTGGCMAQAYRNGPILIVLDLLERLFMGINEELRRIVFSKTDR